MDQQPAWLTRKRCNGIHRIPAIQTLWLLFKEKRTAGEQQFVQSALIARTYESVRRFRQILIERDETALQPWACEAEASQIPELIRFVQKLRLDWGAVENALLLTSSQGQVEGPVNRLKVFKRQGDELRRYVIEHLADEQGVLVVDETGFLKKGKKSAGVAPQYSGAAGGTANCQIGVFLLYASSKGQAFIDRALYLPQEWTQDRVRCREAGIPEEVAFARHRPISTADVGARLCGRGPSTVGGR